MHVPAARCFSTIRLSTQLVRNLSPRRASVPRRRRIRVEISSPQSEPWRAQHERHRSRPCGRDSVLAVRFWADRRDHWRRVPLKGICSRPSIPLAARDTSFTFSYELWRMWRDSSAPDFPRCQSGCRSAAAQSKRRLQTLLTIRRQAVRASAPAVALAFSLPLPGRSSDPALFCGSRFSDRAADRLRLDFRLRPADSAPGEACRCLRLVRGKTELSRTFRCSYKRRAERSAHTRCHQRRATC